VYFSALFFFVSISEVIDCEDCISNDLYGVGWDIKLYSNYQKACRYYPERFFKIRLCAFLLHLLIS